MSFIADLFSGPKKNKQEAAPTTDQKAVQNAAVDARRRAANARGRSSTDIAASRLGNVG